MSQPGGSLLCLLNSANNQRGHKRIGNIIVVHSTNLRPHVTMNKLNHATVMGPETPTTAANNILTPPRLENDTDRLKWREAIREWVHIVKKCTEGGDTRAKGAAATLSMILYQSFEAGYKEIVIEAVIFGEIILKTPKRAVAEAQETIIEKIIQLVSKDSPIDRISRMVRLNATIHQCVHVNKLIKMHPILL